MKRALFIVVPLALLALALAFVLYEGTERESGSPATAPAVAAPREAPAADPVALSSVERPPASDDGAGDAKRTLVDDLAPQPAEAADAGDVEASPEEGLDVRVVVKETQAPVPRALVYFFTPDLLDEEQMLELQAGGLNVDELLTRFGRRYRANDEGRLKVPHVVQGGMIAGQTEGLWAMQPVSGDETEIVVELEPDPALVVRVVDAEGRPVEGAPVALRQKRRWGTYDFLSTPTGADGTVTLMHVANILKQVSEDPVFVALAILLEEPVERELDRKSFPAETIEFVLPPTGSLAVRAVDQQGEPVPLSGVAAISFASDGGSRTPGLGGADTAQVPLKEGRAWFPYVGLGERLGIQLGTADGREPVDQAADGPTRPGESVSVDVVVPITPKLVARLLDGEEKPLAKVLVRTAVETLSPEGVKRNSDNSSFTTDGDGRIEMVIEGDVPPGGARRLLLRHDRDEGGTLGAELDLSGALYPGENDVGDVKLTLPPLLAAGVVTDTGGALIRGADVRGAYGVRRSESRISWRTLRDARARTDADGRFELRGWSSAPDFAVGVSHVSYGRSGYVQVPLGSSDVRIELFGAGSIEGRLLVNEGVELRSVRFALYRGGDPAQRLDVSRDLEGDGSFVLSQVEEGTHTLTLTLRRAGEPLLRFDGVVVRADEVTDDPRLREIDLRGLVYRYLLRVSAPGGGPVPAVEASYRPPGSEEWEYEHESGSELELITTSPALELEVSSGGFRAARLEVAPGEHAITLSPGLPLRFVLEGGMPPLPEGYALAIRLDRADASRMYSEQAVFGTNGEALVFVPGPGTYRVKASLYATDERGSRSRGLVVESPREILVADVAREQAFGVRLDRAGFEATLKRMEEER